MGDFITQRYLKNGLAALSELLMGRQLNSFLPVPKDVLIPKFNTEQAIDDLTHRQDNIKHQSQNKKPSKDLKPG